jgi:P-type E1-E2 ATPase
MIGTFAMVLIFTMLKEAYEDLFRHKQDRELNNKEVYVFNHQYLKFIKKKWKDIVTGELIKIFKDEEFPSDIVLLKSDKESGVVFVDTMNLDGEVSFCIFILVTLD